MGQARTTKPRRKALTVQLVNVARQGAGDVPKARVLRRRDLLYIIAISFSMHPKWHCGGVLVLRARESNKEALLLFDFLAFVVAAVEGTPARRGTLRGAIRGRSCLRSGLVYEAVPVL